MRKQFLLFTLVLIGLLMLPSSGKAAVTPIAGNVDPEISTEAAPKWYTVMSSHITAADRQNRFLVWDGDRLRTEKFDLGIPEDQLEDKYLWRLEQGSTNNKVYIVNKTGLRIYAPDGIENNTLLTMNESGVEWEMKLAKETGPADCAEKQYCFNFSGAKISPAYLNAMDFQNNDADKAYGLTIYDAGVHQASGWFFYEANAQETEKYTVTYDAPENGTIHVTNAQSEVIDSNSSVDAETVLTITATPAEGYVIDYLKVNDIQLEGNTYTVTGNIVITAAFVKEPVVFENKAITIPQTNYSSKIGYRLQVAETILGDRSNTATSRLGKSFTLSAWVNMDKITSDSKNKGAVIMGHGPQVHMNYNGSLVLGVTEAGELKVISGASNKIDQALSSNISLDTWTYLTLIYDNDTYKIKVYKNGVLAGEEIQLSKELELFGDDPCIFFVGGMGFSGLCDEMQFFNKALTSAEVEQAFKNPADMQNLIAWYDFDNLTGENDGSFLNKSTASEKVSEKAVFYKYTGSQSSDPGLISGSVAQAIPTLVDGRTPAIEKYTITLPTEITNGTLTVMNGKTALVAGENEVEAGTILTITATPASGYVLDYLKVNDTPLSENTYTVTADAVVTVAFIEEPAEVAPKAIHVPANDGNIKYQFRFDDIVLGEHENGTNNKWENDAIVDRGDHRARNFTMSVWIKPLNKEGELFGHAQAPFYGAQGTFGVSINSNNMLVLKARAWLDEGRCDGISDLVSNTTLNIDEWAFLTVAVDDDARSIKLYKNGELLGTGDLSVTNNGTEAHGIGLLQDECVFFAANGNSSCDVDEVQVWNKTLTDSEIKASMESFATAPENLIAFYKFDENSIENIPNKGTGVECTAGLVSGTVKRVEAPYWADVYTCTPIQATLVDGHVLPKFAVNYVSETDHGTVIIKNGDKVITSGTKVAQYTTLTIEATPAEGYQVKSIKINDVAIDGNTFVLEKEATITVEFTDKLSVTYTVTGDGTFSILDANINEDINNGDEIEKGTWVFMTIKANEGSEISNFTINGKNEIEQIVGGVYMITSCQTNLDINVEFTKKQYNVTFNSNAYGALVIKKGNTVIENNASVEYGTEVTITAKPTGKAALSKFTINGIDKLNEIKETLEMNVTVNAALDIKAEFAPLWKVTCNITGEGTVKIEDEKGNIHENGASTITEGSAVTLTLTPETGYELSDLMIDGTSYMHLVTDNQFRFEMDADYTFDVVFIKGTSLQNTSADAVSVRYAAGTLHVIGMNAGDRLDIYDIAGNYVRTSEVADTNVSDLADGCYLVKVTTGNTIKTVKFIKK